MDLVRTSTPLRALLRVAAAVVFLVAVPVDLWLLDGRFGASQTIVVAIAAVGITWTLRPRLAPALAVVAAVLSLFETATGAHTGVRFALFTEIVVLPLLFGAVLARGTRASMVLIAGLLGFAGEAIALRADDTAVRAIVAISMVVLLGAAATVVAYIRWRDHERRISIELARQTERVELARELHDVVGHHVTGIVVLAQANRFVHGAERDPSTDRAFAEIEAAGQETLDSVRRLVGLLRTEPSMAAPPRLADVEQIVDALHSSHPATTLVVDDLLRREWLPADVADTVQRLVQEAATNVRRHGDPEGVVRFALHRDEQRLLLDIDNDVLHGAIGVGYGLVGMRERIAALGGTFEAGIADQLDAGRWCVRIGLPLPARSSRTGVKRDG